MYVCCMYVCTTGPLLGHIHINLLHMTIRELNLVPTPLFHPFLTTTYNIHVLAYASNFQVWWSAANTALKFGHGSTIAGSPSCSTKSMCSLLYISLHHKYMHTCLFTKFKLTNRHDAWCMMYHMYPPATIFHLFSSSFPLIFGWCHNFMSWRGRWPMAIVWHSTALRANQHSCTLVWAAWVRAHERWREDGFGRELDTQNCITEKFISVYRLPELAGDITHNCSVRPLTFLVYIHTML